MHKSVLLVGGAGYIGSVVTEHLLNKGYSVTCLDRMIYNNFKSLTTFFENSSFRFLNGDMNNPELMSDALAGCTDVVILAGLVGDPITKSYPLESGLINEVGVKKCIDLLSTKNLGKVILISTCSNYGLISENRLADENYELKPLSLYSKAKVEAERYLLDSTINSDFCPVILRFATAFGLSPRTRFDLTVNEFTKELILGNELIVFDPDTWRPYCHVADFAELIAKVLDAPQNLVNRQVFNAGGFENNFTKRQIVNLLLQNFPDGKVRYAKNGGDPRNYKVDFNKVIETLNFKPKYSVDFGINEIISAFQSGQFNDLEINRNFYGNYEVVYQ